MYANKLCILSYDHALCLKRFFGTNIRRTPCFAQTLFEGSLLGLKYSKAAKPNSKCYLHSVYFYSYTKRSVKRYLFYLVTFYNHFTRQQRKTITKSYSELCSSVAAP